MAEKDFQASIKRSIEAYGRGLYFKIPDIPVSQFGGRASKWAGQKKPFDCFWALEGGLFIPMELKQKRGLSLSVGDKGDIRPHQEEAGLHLNELDFAAVLVVNFQHVYPAKKAAALGIQSVDRVFAVLFSRIVEWRRALMSDSIPLETFATRGAVELEKRPGGTWDVGALRAYCWGRHTEAQAFPGVLGRIFEGVDYDA